MRLSVPTRRGAAFAAALVLVAATITVSSAGPAQASCSALTSRSIAGTLSGADGRDVNALIGFTFVDELGYRLDSRGCRLPGDAYGRVFHLNAALPASGGIPSSANSNKFWIDHIPANVREVWAETYPKGQNGVTDYSHYTGVYQPWIAPGNTKLNLHLPVTCAAGGDTGAIAGTFYIGGHQVTPSWLGFWADSRSPQMGYALAAGAGGGFTSPPLASGQTYQVVVMWNGLTFRQHGVAVSACQTTHIRMDG